MVKIKVLACYVKMFGSRIGYGRWDISLLNNVSSMDINGGNFGLKHLSGLSTEIVQIAIYQFIKR